MIVPRCYRSARSSVALAALALAAACAPSLPPPPAPAPPPAAEPPPAAAPALPPAPAFGLPAVPRVEGPLEIRVVHPTPQTTRPNAAASFVYGSVGTGEARLVINGQPVPVWPNGAFLAYLPLPADGRWVLEAEAAGQRASATVAYAPPPAPGPARAPALVAYPQPVLGTVSGGADTLATGSDATVGRPTPTGTYRWFFPRGATLAVTGERGDQLRVRLAGGLDAWVPARAVTLGGPAPAAPRALGTPELRPAAEWLDLRVPARGAPFLVEPDGASVRLTVYGATPPATHSAPAPLAGDAWLAGSHWSAPAADIARLELRLTRALWGYKAFYEPDGTLVLRLRRPPEIDAANPLRGLRIVVDPGHPPAGATGPTGLTEAEANLNIALPLAELLRERGAEVHLTRTANVPVSLVERVELANAVDAHLLISVHNNAFPEGVDPFRRHGTSTYYFHPHSAALARSLQREIQAATQIPDLGALSGNLALVRPTWMPTALTESLFMLIPEHEAALRHPGFLRNLAAAHVRGIEAFLRQR